MSRYRLIYFVPFLPSDERILIGALIAGDKRSTFVARPELPCESCVGGPVAAAVMRLGVELMSDRPPFDLNIPNSLGPQFWGGKARTFPSNWDETAEEFVINRLLARSQQ